MTGVPRCAAGPPRRRRAGGRALQAALLLLEVAHLSGHVPRWATCPAVFCRLRGCDSGRLYAIRMTKGAFYRKVSNEVEKSKKSVQSGRRHLLQTAAEARLEKSGMMEYSCGPKLHIYRHWGIIDG